MDISAGVLVREGKVVRRGPRQVNKQSTSVFLFLLLLLFLSLLFVSFFLKQQQSF